MDNFKPVGKKNNRNLEKDVFVIKIMMMNEKINNQKNAELNNKRIINDRDTK